MLSSKQKLFSSVVKEDKSQPSTSQTDTSIETSMAVEASENIASNSVDSDKLIEEIKPAEDPISLVAKHEELNEEQDTNKTEETFFVTEGNILDENAEANKLSELANTSVEGENKIEESSEIEEKEDIEKQHQEREDEGNVEPKIDNTKEEEHCNKDSNPEDESLAATTMNDVNDDGVEENTNSITTDEKLLETTEENMSGTEFQEEVTNDVNSDKEMVESQYKFSKFP